MQFARPPESCWARGTAVWVSDPPLTLDRPHRPRYSRRAPGRARDLSPGHPRRTVSVRLQRPGAVRREPAGSPVAPWSSRSARTLSCRPGLAFGVFPNEPALRRGTRPPPGSSHGLRVASEFDPRRTASQRLALMGFASPSAHAVTGSDLHRACLTRLRCVSRLSQPPDAFFLPRPSSLVSCCNAHGIRPSEGSPSSTPESPLGAPAPPDRWLRRASKDATPTGERYP